MSHEFDRFDESTWHRLLSERVSRRDVLRRGAMAAMAACLPLDLRLVSTAAGAGHRPAAELPFVPIQPTTADALVLPEGFQYDLIRVWGDQIGPGLPFGYNADYVAYFPIDGLEGGRAADEGLLWVNHEYPNPLLMYGYRGGRKTRAQIELERQSVGGSVLRVKRDSNGRWAFAEDGRNRRVTANTPCRLTGPAAGSRAVGGAVEVRGTAANCSGGTTPWGTVLTCEENYQDYLPPPEEEGYGWDASFVEEHQGWVTEVDPYDPDSVPLKRTALGRFRHENVALRVAPSGHVVAYMGDDLRGSCIYKFVSDGVYVPGDRAANLRLLETGRLYAADFSSGHWLLLDHAAQPALREARGPRGPRFRDQADVLVDARAAALTLGATPVDRPEDLEIHPHTGEVFASLTNNSAHGNFHGQVVRIREHEGDPRAVSFAWDFFAVGGPQSGFSSPDNSVFDAGGNLWLASDVSSSEVGTGIYAFQGNNSLFFLPTEGPDAGRAYPFASGPVQCELTGPYWTPDGTTLFLAVQHPGEETTSLSAPTSRWPHRGNDLPLPGVVAITGFAGWGDRWNFPYW